MADPFRKVNPGDEVVFQSETWNSLLDAAKAEKLRTYSQTSETSSQPANGTIIKVKNQSGSDLPRLSILGLQQPIFLPASNLEAFKDRVLFRGILPVAAHKGKYCILLDPIADGAIGRAYIDGVAPVKINITNAAHVCCEVIPGDTSKLVSAATGTSSILWAESGSGEKWAIIRFDNAGCSCEECNPVAITIRNCSDNTLISGAVVTVYDEDDNEVDTATTTSTGVVSIDIPVAGDYRIKVEKTGQVTATVVETLACGQALVVFLGRVINVTVNGCNSTTHIGSGTLVEAKLSGKTYSALTNSSGVAAVAIQSTGTHTIVTTHPSGRFNVVTTSQSVVACVTNITRNFGDPGIAAGYRCFTSSFCSIPVSETLHLTDSVYGAVTLTFQVGASRWFGSKVVAYPGCGICPARSANLTYEISAVNAQLQIISTGSFCDSGSNVALLDSAPTCPPSAFSAAYHQTSGTFSKPYCTTPTFTVTE